MLNQQAIWLAAVEHQLAIRASIAKVTVARSRSSAWRRSFSLSAVGAE